MKLALQWPRTLASRLWLVFLVGLILAQALTFAAQYYERYESTKTAMLGNFEHDTATSIAILDRLPAAERLNGPNACNVATMTICCANTIPAFHSLRTTSRRRRRNPFKSRWAATMT